MTCNFNFNFFRMFFLFFALNAVLPRFEPRRRMSLYGANRHGLAGAAGGM